jgi:alkylation response protein AidB-like acyl-CoA dehydrogenase
MSEYHPDMRDIRFVLFEQLKAQTLVQYDAFKEHDEQMYDMILTEAERFATEDLAPIRLQTDEEGCSFEDGVVKVPQAFHKAYHQMVDNGWLVAKASQKWGGMNLPMSLSSAITELQMGGCCSFLFTPGLTIAAAELLESCASEELQNRFLPHMYDGSWAGTMCLTESQAGSAVGDIRTTAGRNDDGSYSIKGNKIFISSGEQDITENIIHLVLAKVPDAPAGIKGVSLFIVPKYRDNADGSMGEFNDVRCTGIEEKMGIHASSTCSMSFGDDDNCQGWIIGGEGEGIRHMFHMMNTARIEVGMQGVALGAAAYALALRYAKERVQGTKAENFRDANAPRVAIIEHANVRRMLLDCKAVSEAGRAMAYKAAICEDLSNVAETEEERVKAQAMLDVLTPVVKAHLSESGFHATDVAMQIHGGYGYIKEYGVEQHMRDVRIAPVYEGTNSIQALDLIGRKVARKGGQDFMVLMNEIDTLLNAQAEHPAIAADVKSLKDAKNVLMVTTMSFAGYQMQGQMNYVVQNCRQYLEMFGDVVCSWLLLEQAVIGHEKAKALVAEDSSRTPENNDEVCFYDGKVKTAQFYARQYLPRVHMNAARVKSNDNSPMEITF